MKAVLLTLLFAALGNVLLGQKTESTRQIVVTQKVRVVAQAVESTTKQGEPISVRVRIRNLSKEPVPFTRFGPKYDYTVLVADLNANKEPRQTEFGRGRFSTYVPVSAQSLSLGPGEEWEETVDIAELYELPPGRYRAYLRRNLKARSYEEGLRMEERAFSNAFEFTVVPR